MNPNEIIRAARSRANSNPELPPDHRCPANGCPNAASTAINGSSRFACYYHATALAAEWPSVTEFIHHGWPATANWGPEKAAYEASKAEARRVALPNPKKSHGGLSEAIGEALQHLGA